MGSGDEVRKGGRGQFVQKNVDFPQDLELRPEATTQDLRQPIPVWGSSSSRWESSHLGREILGWWRSGSHLGLTLSAWGQCLYAIAGALQ